jgi:uncharacterized protein (TIGR03435 family)
MMRCCIVLLSSRKTSRSAEILPASKEVIEKMIPETGSNPARHTMRSLTVVLTSLFVLFVSLPAFGQQPSASPVFEVASVKLSKTPAKPSLRVFSDGRTIATNATLKQLIAFAYGLQDYQIIGGPKWIDAAQYDIEAKPEASFQAGLSGPEYARRVQQSFLENQFRLRLRRTSKDLPIYLLTAGRDGTLLKERPKPVDPADMQMTSDKGMVAGSAIPTAIIAESLSSILGLPVSDTTGLTGYYDFRLQWTPSETGRESAATGVDSSLVTAIQQQLGLGLEAGRGPVEVLSIESAAQPSNN